MTSRTRNTRAMSRSIRPDGIVPVKTCALAKRKTRDSCVLVYLASLGTDKSRMSIIDALKRVIRVLDVRGPDEELVSIYDFRWHKIRYKHMQVIRSRLAEKASPATANHALAAVRGVIEVAWKQHQMSTDAYQRARSVKGVKGSRVTPGRHIRITELRKLFAMCDTGRVSGYRDAAVLSLMYGAGLRRFEVAKIPVNAIDIDRKAIRLVGKGNKERELFLPDGTVQTLKEWTNVRGNREGPLILVVTKHGTIGNRGLTPEGIRKLVMRLEKRAGIKHISTHDFRRTYISDLLDSGTDLATVQKMAGHSSPTTTARYDRRGERDKQRAAESLVVPTVKRKKSDQTDTAGES